MIPTRPEVQLKVTEYYTTLPEMTLAEYITNWLNTLGLPDTITVASNQISPAAQILADLDTYVK